MTSQETPQTQAELESMMYAFGRHRAERMMASNEEAGRANNNPYASAVYRRFILPLADLIREDIETKTPGRRKAHAALLEPMNPEAVAFLAVRNILNECLNSDKTRARSAVTAVGKACYHELMLGLFEEAEPALFHTLVNDLGRRMSKSERHRMTVFKMQARDNGVPVPEWGAAGVEQVGSYLVDQLERLGMLETQIVQNVRYATKVSNSIDIKLSEEVLDLIGQIKDRMVETTPYYLPCIEQPKDWLSFKDGGFHTRAMRRLQPFAVRSYGGREHFEEADMTVPLAAMNALQRTAWQINGDMLDAIRKVARHFDMDEILSQAEFPAPPKPDWLEGSSLKPEDMNEAQLEEFIAWKRQKSEWFTQMKLRGTKYGRFYTATTVADKFRNFPAIYFVYFADFRGRLYAQTTGVSPQGSDMQKALLRFATGKPLLDYAAYRWFCIHGANKWGYDKASLDDRVRWAEDRKDLILSFADSPVDNTGWTEADSPLQFLAWCMEFARYTRDPASFLSHLPIGMDGSCNGLQNFSAMLRDEVGGKATNLVPGPLPSDIYQMVADVTAEALCAAAPHHDDPDKKASLERYRRIWLDHGINRSLVKRSVMTLPYGSTRFSCADFIVGDYLKLGKVPQFEKAEYQAAAQYLSHFVWDAIGEVVVKAREAMTWLQASARQIIKGGAANVSWTAPCGFPVKQFYQEQDSHRIRTNLCGNAFLRINVDGARPDINAHKNGVAPNFIHSFDAAHLKLVSVEAAKHGLDLAMIHDDYGTHAADAELLYRIIREVFVRMYEAYDPLQAFADAYALPQPPAKGSLDLSSVLSSPYFFS